MTLNARDLNFPDCGHPHSAIIRFFNEIFREFMTSDKEFMTRDKKFMIGDSEVFYEALNLKLKQIFDVRASFPGIYNPDEKGSLYGYWDSDLKDDDGVEPFETGSRYLIKFFWRDDTSVEYLQGYEFPLVFYSPAETHAWFVWAMNKCITFFPEHKQGLTDVMRQHVDVEAALKLMQKRLDGEEFWEYGPAGFFQIKKHLWVRKAKSPAVNDWIRQWIS